VINAAAIVACPKQPPVSSFHQRSARPAGLTCRAQLPQNAVVRTDARNAEDRPSVSDPAKLGRTIEPSVRAFSNSVRSPSGVCSFSKGKHNAYPGPICPKGKNRSRVGVAARFSRAIEQPITTPDQRRPRRLQVVRRILKTK